MTILRLRTEVADERGGLGRLATAIAACRGNILGLDVHFLDGHRVADEFVVEFAAGGSADALITALRRAGGLTVDAQRLDEHALVDPVARAIDISAQLVAAASPDRGLERAVTRLVRADRVRFVEAGEACPPADGWTMTVPDEGGRGRGRRWLVAERRRPAFSSSEIARVAALVRLSHAAAGDARALTDAALARVGPPRPVSRRPGSFRRALATTHPVPA